MELSRLLEGRSLSPLGAVHAAIRAVGTEPAPLPVLVAAAGICPRVYFTPLLSAEVLINALLGADSVVALAAAGGAEARLLLAPHSARAAFETGAALLCRSTSAAQSWKAFLPGVDSPQHLARKLSQSAFCWVIAIARGTPTTDVHCPNISEVVSNVLVASASEPVNWEGHELSSGTAAIDTMRRTLAKVAQEGLEAWPYAAGWLTDLLEWAAGSFFLSAEALHLVKEKECVSPRTNHALLAAAANFYCASAYGLNAKLVAHAGLQRSGEGQAGRPTDLDPAVWGVVYESLRQVAYHWRAALTWVSRSLGYLESAQAL